MSETPPDPRQTDAWGIDRYYQDAYGDWKQIPEETRMAVMAAMEAEPDAPAPDGEAPVLFLRPGRPACLIGAGTLLLESGEEMDVKGTLPSNLPFGYHILREADSGVPLRIIVSPERCYLPEALHVWGWSLQLYAMHSRRSQGIGDLADLRRFAKWSAEELGAGVLMINPLHAAAPTVPQQASPYFPSSRRYRNPLYIAVDEVEGAGEVSVPRTRRLIDRDAVFVAKMAALEQAWKAGACRGEAFDEYLQREGRDLERFATYCALAEKFGGGWQGWPGKYHNPGSEPVRHFLAENIDRVRFHCWLQWLLDLQLAKASYALALMQDLPIGVDPGGADAWMYQDIFAKGVSVGAPPDKFNTQGQDWGLPPFVPWKLRAAGYEPFIQTIRATLRHAGGLRVDHVLGLFRLFWVPQGLGPAKGAYVRYNADEMLAIIALESHRAQAFVAGEDLGTVEPGVSEKLQRNGILSYRVFWFEKEPPATYPEMALASISTHDLPTIAGMWSGSDLELQRKLGLKPNEAETRASRAQITTMTGLKDGAPTQDVIVKVHELLAQAPSRIITAQIDDALAVEERPNMPATMADKHPNWSISLPKPIEEIEKDSLVRRVASVLLRSR